MPLVPFEPDPKHYDDIFEIKSGCGSHGALPGTGLRGVKGHWHPLPYQKEFGKTAVCKILQEVYKSFKTTTLYRAHCLGLKTKHLARTLILWKSLQQLAGSFPCYGEKRGRTIALRIAYTLLCFSRPVLLIFYFSVLFN